MTRRAALLFGSTAVPVLAWAVAIVTAVSAGLPGGSWWAMFRSLAPDAFLWTSVLVVVAAPLAGVMVAVPGLRPSSDPDHNAERSGWYVAWSSARRLGAAVLLLVGVSAVLTLVSIGQTRIEALTFIATSHAVLGTVTLALAAVGTLCGRVVRDPLDAAALSLVIAIAAAAGVLVAGTLVDDAPRPVVSVALSASPLVAMVSAADIDVVRMDLFYRISPLARLGVTYPSWSSTCGWYALGALVCFMGTTRTPAYRQAMRGSRRGLR